MLRKKRNTKKPLKRVVRKRNRTIVTVVFLSIGLSFAAILLAVLLMKNPVVISPIAVKTLAAEDTNMVLLTRELRKVNLQPVNVITRGDTITLKLSSKEEVLLSTKQDLAPQLASLQLIMARLTMEGKHFTRLDLRFDKPVIVFGN